MATVAVKVTPGAKRNQVAGLANGVLRVKIAAKAIDGKANDALVKYIAEIFGVRRRNVAIIKGLTSRDKVLAIEGLTQAQIEAIIIAVISNFPLKQLRSNML